MGHSWLLLSWTPESATIRHKMLYASTKATLKTEFGSAHIKEEINATTDDEITLNAYHKHKLEFSGPGPLTSREEELQEMRKNEINTSIHIDSRHQTLGGIQCPITDDAKKSIVDMINGRYNYLQFEIKLQEEQIYLSDKSNIELLALPKKVPIDNARLI